MRIDLSLPIIMAGCVLSCSSLRPRQWLLTGILMATQLTCSFPTDRTIQTAQRFEKDVAFRKHRFAPLPPFSGRGSASLFASNANRQTILESKLVSRSRITKSAWHYICKAMGNSAPSPLAR